MRRGEIWTVLADGYARKPRPVVVVQNILAVHTLALGQRIGILEDDVMRQVEKKLAHVLAL